MKSDGLNIPWKNLQNEARRNLNCKQTCFDRIVILEILTIGDKKYMPPKDWGFDTVGVTWLLYKREIFHCKVIKE